MHLWGLASCPSLSTCLHTGHLLFAEITVAVCCCCCWKWGWQRQYILRLSRQNVQQNSTKKGKKATPDSFVSLSEQISFCSYLVCEQLWWFLYLSPSILLVRRGNSRGDGLWEHCCDCWKKFCIWSFNFLNQHLSVASQLLWFDTSLHVCKNRLESKL